MSSDINFTLRGRFFYDAVFDWTDNYSEKVEEDQEADSDLRDAFMDISLGNWDFRLGKQQIVWGEAVGIFMADVVNAKDLREFILPDFEDQYHRIHLCKGVEEHSL